MMSAHTPGPWVIVGDDQEAKVVRTGDGIVSHVARLNDQWLCEEHGGSVLANARLIAAAPDMLKALSELQAALDECNKPGLKSDHAMLLLAARDAADRAIAKAQGAS